jgi:hypothetical protein
MACRFCGSGKQKVFSSEVSIHPPHGLKYLRSGCVFAFPRMLVCLDCGLTELVLEDRERNELAQLSGSERSASGQRNGAAVSRSSISKVN